VVVVLFNSQRVASVAIDARGLTRRLGFWSLSAVVVMCALVVAAPARASMGTSVVKVSAKNGGGEPSIAPGPGSRLYVSYPASAGPMFFRSLDHGVTWHQGPTVDTSSGDTSVNVDSSGAVYESNLNGHLQGDVYKSTDGGKTFPQKGTSIDGMDSTSQPFAVDRQWVDAWIPPGATTSKARVYMEYHDFGPSQVWVTTSSDGGKTFGTPVDVVSFSPQAEAATFCNSIPGGVKVVQSGPHAGRIYAAWLAADLPTNVATGCNLTQLNTFHSVWIAWSDDGGATWSDHLVFDGGFGHDASALFADLTLDKAGNPYVAFGDNLVGEWDMYVEASFDNGETWNGSVDGSGGPYLVNHDSGTHFFPAIVAGAPGKVDVSYIATPTKIATLPYGKPSPGGGAGASWYLYASQSLNLLSGHPTWSVKRITPAPMHVGDVCTLGIFCVAPSSNRDLLDFIDGTVDPGGQLHVSFTQDTASHNGIYVANQTSGTGLGG
jgi:hypothetical protein